MPDRAVAIAAAGLAVAGLWMFRAAAEPPRYDGPNRQKTIDPLPPEPPAPPRVAGQANNPIDQFIADKWRRFAVRPAKLATDLDLVRRIFLDIAGVVPTVEEVDAFLHADRGARVGKLVDRLLASPQYAEHWTVFWGDLLREQSQTRGAEPFALRDYLRDVLADGVPYDRWVRSLITAEGTTEDDPAAAFVLGHRSDPDELTITVAQAFMGTQLACAQCHDHPFEPWLQSDFLGMRDFWRGTRVRNAEARTVLVRGRPVQLQLETVMSGTGAGSFVTGAESASGAGRAALAELLTAADNPYFARVAVNRVWAKLMGRGLVEPVDEFRADNPPSHPELLDWLAREFIDNGYDLRHVIRLICTSRTYQLDTTRGVVPRNVYTEAFFERMPLRRLTAEQLHDSILVSCGLFGSDRPMYQRAFDQSYPRPASSFIGTFHGHDRQTLHQRDTEVTIQQALELLNGPFLNNAVRLHDAHPVRRWLAAGDSASLAVRKLFVSTLGREPTRPELDAATSYVSGPGSDPARWADVHWALINTREFMFIR
ncbi:MAG: DUF1553 domain-containing protein [Phycisphaerales bacterium]|nr:MAG: DUF1553 domain-containing protein [Phycisphaerales bacterium]